MPLEKGGRADKAGNRYEIKCIIYELLNLINETNYSVVVEALGENEQGTDILVTNFDGVKEHQQCKVRNASKEYWEMHYGHVIILIGNGQKTEFCDCMKRIFGWLVFMILRICFSDCILNIKNVFLL